MGSVRLVDLGRAVVIGERISILLGSPFYMAPEVHRLEPARIQSDIYGAGLVGLEMLCGQSLLHSLSMAESDLLSYKMTLLRRLDSMLPNYVRENRLLVGIFKRMLDPDPSGRYATATEAEDGAEGMREVHRQLSRLHLDAEYDRELENYLEKLSDPETGNLNPRLDWE
jgi:serine/threonine protein kinase